MREGCQCQFLCRAAGLALAPRWHRIACMHACMAAMPLWPALPSLRRTLKASAQFSPLSSSMACLTRFVAFYGEERMVTVQKMHQMRVPLLLPSPSPSSGA